MKTATRTWTADAEFSLEVNVADGQWIESHAETPLPEAVARAIQRAAPREDWGEIVVPFTSDGYYAPQTYDSPEEGDDERTQNGLAYFYVDRRKLYFTAAESQMLFDEYEERIQDADVDTTPYDGPDEY